MCDILLFRSEASDCIPNVPTLPRKHVFAAGGGICQSLNPVMEWTANIDVNFRTGTLCVPRALPLQESFHHAQGLEGSPSFSHNNMASR